MFRLLLRPTALLFVLLILPVALIRVQPYGDPALRKFLMPPLDCPAPCFMGIRPGATGVEDAVAILEDLGWLQGDPSLPLRSPFYLHWSGLQPPWLDRQVGGVMAVVDETVDYLEIRILTRVGDVKLLLGTPDKQQYRPGVVLYGGGAAFQYSAWYAETGIEVAVNGLCPTSGGMLNFNGPTTIRLRSTPPDWPPDTQRVPCRA